MNNYAILLLGSLISFVFLFACQSPETDLILSHGEPEGKLHKDNIGKIKFMEVAIPYEDFAEKHFLQRLNLGKAKDFNMRVFLSNTQTHYLDQLAPNMTVNDLCKNGSYHFKFYVDNRLVYEDLLNTGAGSCSYRNDASTFRVPLISSNSEDHWGRFLWMRFMKKGGGEDALLSGEHKLRIEMRPYIKVKELVIGDLIASGEILISSEEKKVDPQKVKVQEIQENEDWGIADNVTKEKPIEELNTKIAQDYFKNITSIAIAKDGELVLEEYFNGSDRTTLHDTRSVGKSFLGAAFGKAIEEGHIKSVQSELKQFYEIDKYKNPSKEKASISIQQLLNMNSVLDASDRNPDSPGNEEKMYVSENWVDFTLNLNCDPDKISQEAFDYISAGTVLLGDILNKSVPNGLESYFKQTLFDPLQIKNFKWQYTPQGLVNTAGSLQMSSLDLLKFGQLFKNGGTWNGESVLPKSWTEKCMKAQVLVDPENNVQYSNLFWNNHFIVNDQSYEVAHASGNGGNNIFIFKELPIVVVITATAYNEAYAHFQVKQMMERYILPAIL